MADDNPRMYSRDAKTGRFATVDIERDVIAPDLGTPETFAGDLRRRYAPAGDTLAGAGPSYGASPLRARNPVLVHPDEIARDTRDVGNEVLRSAARDSGPMDPSYELVSGFRTHGASRPVRAEEVSDGR